MAIQTISASVVLFQTKPADLFRLVECYLRSDCAGTLYLIDNSPSETDISRFSDSRIQYRFNNSNLGYGAGHNVAINESVKKGYKYHVVLNPDVYFDTELLTGLLGYAETHSSVGLIMPKVLYPDGSLQYLCKLLPTPFDLIGRRFLPFKSIVEKRNQRFELRGSGYNQAMNIPYLSGCFMFLRNEAVTKVGAFDEKIFMYCEDIDLSRRIHEHYQTIFLPNFTIIHEHKKESFVNKKLLKAHVKSAIYYFNKWGWIFDRERRLFNKRALTYLEKQDAPD